MRPGTVCGLVQYVAWYSMWPGTASRSGVNYTNLLKKSRENVSYKLNHITRHVQWNMHARSSVTNP